MQLILRTQKDYKISVSNKEPCSVLVDELRKHENLEGKRAQLFFSGRMLQEAQPIGSYIKEDGVVTVFLRNAAV